MKRLWVLVVALVVVALGAPPAAQAAVKYFSTTKTVTGTGSVTCSSGWKVTGGGAQVPNNYYGSSTSTEYQLRGSYPTSNGWKADATRVSGRYSSSQGWRFTDSGYSAKVWAICIR